MRLKKSTPSMSPGVKPGFTLLELLIAIGIIGLVVSMLLPTLSRAREKAYAAQCQNNLKQIGLGLFMYIQDSDEVLTRSCYGTCMGGAAADSDLVSNYKWMDVAMPYMMTEKSFMCPSDRTTSATYAFRSGENYGGYGLNAAYGNPGDAQSPPRSGIFGGVPYTIKIGDIRHPSSTVWVTDCDNSAGPSNLGGSWAFFWGDASANPTITTNDPRKLSTIVERHGGRANVLWCDGHVTSEKLETLAATKNIGGADVMTLLTIEDD